MPHELYLNKAVVKENDDDEKFTLKLILTNCHFQVIKL